MGQSKNKVIPIVTLSDIFGQDLILNSRPSFSNYGWLPKSQARLACDLQPFRNYRRNNISDGKGQS